ncbi:NAD(P)H-hydrate epimerase [Thermopirellula anaerolimosa]
MNTIAVLSRKWIREIDRRAIEEYGIPGPVLMENAGRGTADLLCRLGINGTVLIICGRGNNAGDGFVIARHLELRGFRAEVLLCSSPDQLKGDALLNFDIIRKSDIPIHTLPVPIRHDDLSKRLDAADWIVDAMLGTGSVGPARRPFDEVIVSLNRSGKKVLAVDLPSGLDCDEGPTDGVMVRADVTATFVAWKSGFLVEGAADFLGRVHVLDIGAPRKLIREVLREAAEDERFEKKAGMQ